MDSPQLLYEGRRFRVERVVQVMPDGTGHEREVIRHPGAVTVLPRFDDGRVCLIRNHRVAVEQTLYELPAGILEPGEDPHETARRELAEETGYRADALEKLAEFYTTPGVLDELMHLYLATGLTAGPMRLESGEDIEPQVVPWDEALAMARDGRIRDGKTLVGLLFYETFR